MNERVDVLIVGAGPSGLTLACELISQGISFRIIDKSMSSTKASRAIGISARALEVLHHFGAAEQLVERGVRCGHAHFHSGARQTAKISAETVRHCRFPFMLSVPQSATEEVLERRLTELGGTVERGVELVGLDIRTDSVIATVAAADGASEEPVTAGWVVGADGSHSAVRKFAGIPFDTQEAPETFMIVDVFGERSSTDAGHYYFHPDGMALIAPLPDGSFRLAATVHGAQGRATTLEYVQELFDRRTGSGIRVRELRDAGWGVATVKVRTGIASRYRSGRCLIVGDAAHSYGPLGGQGMNGGIQDSCNLAWKLALVCRGVAGESLLDSYEKERLHGASLAMRAATSQTRLATIRPRVVRYLRDALLGLGTVTGLLDRLLIPTLTQLSIGYPAEALPGADQAASAQAGRRVPDVAISATVRVHDLLQPGRFTALVVGARPTDSSEIEGIAKHFEARHRGLVSPVVLGREAIALSLDGIEQHVDADGVVHAELAVGRPSVLLVRPDGRLAARRSLSKAEELSSVLDQVLGSTAPLVAATR
ncbi:2-polyprenyl-6-methoxyphenol hydroxylase-like FAD-dependent oxidoreductase [Nocardia tenerifensis]|uniref:2-polyprenyl-6-methoxyphenol hydroxylase-like FAD-dependent oxidoreductase n=1 Tax=Nocardia tenerifensis TaxID=228006 RepID=A0A318JTB7_9NOCA|nr:FAD-dependent monooxygenase [Nocardia tenerifensis]PXX54884.1 2-polyprenyl-6-methoxyphenol hydroxylase-like FAD-dependent oxidoreductase [Nocardia tenerifensis]